MTQKTEEKEVSKRRDEALRHALSTPPKPQSRTRKGFNYIHILQGVW
ncbi:hypothetical protein ACX3P1_23855 [Mesorhizobium sp. A623]